MHACGMDYPKPGKHTLLYVASIILLLFISLDTVDRNRDTFYLNRDIPLHNVMIIVYPSCLYIQF